MRKLFTFKKLSTQIAFMVGVIVFIVAGGVAGYMQTRIITEIGRHSRLSLQHQATETAMHCDALMFDSAGASAIESLIAGVKPYDNGFALLKERDGAFIETNDFIRRLGASDSNRLADAARTSQNDVFEIKLGETVYLGAAGSLINNYDTFILAPKNEVNAEIIASLTRFIVIFVVAYSIVLVVAYFIGKNMGKPVAALSGFMRRAGATGDIIYTDEDKKTMTRGEEIGGEIGQLILDCATFMEHIFIEVSKLESIANGDLTVEIETLSDKDTIAGSLNKMVDNLNGIFAEIISSSSQVSAGAKQIADGSQSLAQGSTEQAASIEQLSAAAAEISGKTKDNSDKAEKAAMLASTIKSNAEKGSRQMGEMTAAVNDINMASHSIQKVIKVIDDIAFQTNILALNAAVEAARAGQHGKGFAVVAEEVRNLAAKSAEAAKDTEGLISNSMEKAELGSRIAEDTAASLAEIVQGINESSQIVTEIAQSSDEQLAEITQINHGIDQVGQVVQQNSATAEESAAASEEMSGQSAMLEALVAHFKIKDGNTRAGLPAAGNNRPKHIATPENNEFAANSGGYGKY